MNGFADISVMEMESVTGGQELGVKVTLGIVSVNNKGVVTISSPTPLIQGTVSFNIPKIASDFAKNVGNLVATVTGYGWANNVRK